MDISRISVSVASLAVGIAAGIALGAYCGKTSVSKPEQPAPERPARVKSEKDSGKDSVIRSLRARVAELERLLAEKNAVADVPAAVGEKPDERQEADGRRRGGRHGPPNMAEMRKSMEEFKRDHPEEYAAMEKRRQEFMSRMKQREQATMDFLADVDTANMTDAEREQHANYQNLLSRRAELREKMGAQDISDEDRDRIFEELRETEHAIRESSGQVRENLIKRTAEVLGFEGDEVGEIADTIQAVLDATESGGGRRPGGPGGGMPPPSPR